MCQAAHPSSRRIALAELSCNLLTTFPLISPNFGKSYRIRNLLTTFPRKSPNLGKSYRSRNLLTTFPLKSPNFGKFYRSRNLLTTIERCCCDQFKKSVYRTFSHAAPAERLSTVSSPFMVFSIVFHFRRVRFNISFKISENCMFGIGLFEQ